MLVDVNPNLTRKNTVMCSLHPDMCHIPFFAGGPPNLVHIFEFGAITNFCPYNMLGARNCNFLHRRWKKGCCRLMLIFSENKDSRELLVTILWLSYTLPAKRLVPLGISFYICLNLCPWGILSVSQCGFRFFLCHGALALRSSILTLKNAQCSLNDWFF